MYKIWSYYNHNKLKVWTVILFIIFMLAIIRALNMDSKNRSGRKENKETTSNVVSYHNESKSMVDGDSVSKKYSEDLGKFINQFFTYCVEHNPQAAYNMIANDTKQELYQTEELFEKNYYKNRFEGDKQFSFQSWSSSNNLFIYQVKIFDNMLTTGKTSDNYIEEYVTISNNEGEYKINLNSYLGSKSINKKTEDDTLAVQVIKVDRYLDYEIYTINIKNKTATNLLIDTRSKNNTCYVEDNLENKFDALLYENNESDFKFAPNEVKTIKIKFNVAYRLNLEIKSINFTDIVDSLKYSKDKKIYRETFRADI